MFWENKKEKTEFLESFDNVRLNLILHLEKTLHIDFDDSSVSGAYIEIQYFMQQFELKLRDLIDARILDILSEDQEKYNAKKLL